MAILTQVEVFPASLDEILALPEPLRMEALTEFIEDNNMDGEVLLKTNDGKPMTVVLHNGRKVNISNRGKRVGRRLAVDMLLLFGRYGQYYQKDLATGITVGGWAAMPPKMRERYADFDLKFIEQYLYHAVDADAGEGDEAAETE